MSASPKKIQQTGFRSWRSWLPVSFALVWLLYQPQQVFAGPVAEPIADESANAAMRVLDDWMTAFNARDMQTWAATLNYPHVRFASGKSRFMRVLKSSPTGKFLNF